MYAPALRPFLALLVLALGFAVTHAILWQWIGFNPTVLPHWKQLLDFVLENRSLPEPFVYSLAGGYGVVIVLAIIPQFFMRQTGYGDARRANRRDIKTALLADQPGVVCGAIRQNVLAYSGPRTSGVIAPAGAGKSVGMIFPTVVNLDARTSAIIHDPKHEIFDATASWREKIGPVFRFCPTDPTADCWNPLNGPDLPENFGDLQTYLDMINAVLFPTNSKESGESHWLIAASAATKTATLFNILSARNSDVSTAFSQIYAWFAHAGQGDAYKDAKDPVGSWLIDKATEAVNAGWPDAIADGLFVLAQKDNRERASVISTVLTRLEMFANENVAQTTGHSSFSLRDVRENDRPITIYLDLPENVRKSMSRLSGLFLQCLANQTLSYSERKSREINKVCFVLDELPGLPPIEAIEAIPARGRGLGVWGVYAAQSYSQIYDAFGRDRGKVITELFTYLVVLQLNSPDTQEEISKAIGDYTRKRSSHSYSGTAASPLGREGEQQSLEAARLIRPEELGNLKLGECIISVQGSKTRPIACKTAYHVKKLRKRLTL